MDFNYARTMLAEETADRVLNIKRSFTSALELGTNQGECSRSLRFIKAIMISSQQQKFKL